MTDAEKQEKDFAEALQNIEKYRELAQSYEEELKQKTLKKLDDLEAKILDTKQKLANRETPDSTPYPL